MRKDNSEAVTTEEIVKPAATEPPKASKLSNKRPLLFAALSIVLLVGAIWGTRLLAYSRSHASTDDAAVNGDNYTISSKINGRIEKVLVDSNDVVKRGQLLATLDARDIRVQLAQARAVLATEEANARAAGVNIAITRKSTGSATSQAQAAVEIARAQVETARQQAQAAQSQVPAARAAVNVARAGTETARQQARAGASDLPSAQAAVKAAQAQELAAQKQANVGRAQIRAAEAQIAAAREAVTDAKNNIGATGAGINAAREAVSEAEAGIDVARQTLVSTQSQVKAARDAVGVAEAEITTADARAKQAQADLDRAKFLYQGDAGPRVQIEVAQEALTTAQAAARAARQRRDAAQSNVTAAEAAVQTAQAGIAQATARRNQARSALTQAEVSGQNSGDAVRAAQAKVAQTVAGLEQARQSAAALRADVAGQQAKIKQAQAAVQAARGNYAALQASVGGQRAKEAQAATGIEEAQRNAAAQQAAVEAQRAKIAQAQAALQGTATAPEQVSVSEAQARSAIGKVQQARAQVDALLLQLSYTNIVAPHDGVVSRKNVMAGQTVQNGQTLLIVSDLGSVYVTANFKETQLTGMKPGSPAEVEVDAYPGRTFHGHVDSFSAGTGAVFSLLPPENASGNFTKVVQRVPVKIAIDNPDDANAPLRLGMSVTATIDTAAAPKNKSRDERAAAR